MFIRFLFLITRDGISHFQCSFELLIRTRVSAERSEARRPWLSYSAPSALLAQFGEPAPFPLLNTTKLQNLVKLLRISDVQSAYATAIAGGSDCNQQRHWFYVDTTGKVIAPYEDDSY